MQTVSNKQIPQELAIVMAGISKVLVGELVETGMACLFLWLDLALTRSLVLVLARSTAKTAMDEAGDTGPIRPRHIREAYRRLRNAGRTPYSRYERRLFKR